MNLHPPKWADRFLAWYCNPDLLEEIQGDAHELYFERIRTEGKRKADIKYMWDVLRFFRWSNIRREENEYEVGKVSAIWGLNFLLATRNASRNKLIFIVKTIGLSLCLAFSLLLTAFVVNEISFDKFHVNHNRIYRVTSKVDFHDHITHYAVTPLPLGQTLKEDIPEIENYFRFMFEDKPIFRVGEEVFYNETTFSADSNFLKILSFDFLQGDDRALSGPDKIVLTKSLATKFFGEKDPFGQFIEFGNDGALLEVTAVINDPPSNSHLQFDALISWDTYDRWDDWGNLNAYTYILLKTETGIEAVKNKMPSVLNTFHELVAREYKAKYEAIFENITDIHFSETLDEDIVLKRNNNYVLILIAVIVLFLITGLINYLNLSLAELTTNFKRMGILRIFGGIAGSHRKIITSDILLSLIIVIPLTFTLSYFGWALGNSHLSIRINPEILFNPIFISVICGVLIFLVTSSQVNAHMLSNASYLISSLKGKLNSTASGTGVRKILVAAQLSFSIIMIGLIIVIVNQFHFIQETDKGFEEKNTLVVKLRSGSHSKIESFNEDLRKISGITKVDGSSYYPGIVETKYVFEVETKSGMEQLLVPMMQCGYDYLSALDIKIAEGREFRHDRGEDPSGSFIINETAAREFGWENPIGKQIRGPISGHDEAYKEGEVIGVVKDFNFASLHTKIEPLIIFLTDENWGIQFIYIKINPLTSGDLINIENEYKKHWEEYPFEWEYLDSKYKSLYEKDYEVKSIFEIGLLISILISSLGIFSVSALLVTLRTKEMGIRKVVGANTFQLFFLHTKSFLQFLIISVLVAWPIIWFLSNKWLQNFAYHVDLNIWYFIIPAIIAFFITMLTSGYHGIKSASVNPVDILKQQ